MHKFLVDSNETKLIGLELSEVNGSKVIRSEVNQNLFSPKTPVFPGTFGLYLACLFLNWNSI
jgi:hypothetical protein